MPWWTWVIIWVGLVLALIAVLVLGAIWLWRKFWALMDDLGTLADTTSAFDQVESDPPVRSVPAVLRAIDEVRHDRAVRVARKTERTRLRRVRRLERARAITGLDASTMRWPADWYRTRR